MYTINKPYNECGFFDPRFNNKLCVRSHVYYADSRGANYNENFEEYIFRIGNKLKNIVSIQINGLKVLQRWSDLPQQYRTFKYQIIAPNDQKNDYSITFNDNECNNGDIDTFVAVFNKKSNILQISVEQNNYLSWYIKNQPVTVGLRILIIETPLARLLGIRDFDDAYVSEGESAIKIKNSKQHSYYKPNIYLSITNFPFLSSLNSIDKNICYQVLPDSKKDEYVAINHYGTFMKLQQSTKNINEFKVKWYYWDGTVVDMSNSVFAFEIIFYYAEFMTE